MPRYVLPHSFEMSNTNNVYPMGIFLYFSAGTTGLVGPVFIKTQFNPKNII